jgi:alkylation response protein AidB-like acyl-CoA dehydrogenase
MPIDTTLLDVARGIAPVLREYCEQAERERRLATPVVDAMAEAGLWRMVTPKSLGGLEVDPLTCARVIEEVAKADSAAGWALTNPLIYAFSCARLSAAGVEAIIGRNPNSVIVGLTPTPIQATPVAGGYRVTGRLPFVSHCRNATWFTANARLGETAQQPGGSALPEIIRVFIPMETCEIIDTWDVLGMRGTGSHDVAVTDVFVPEILTFPVTPDFVPGAHYQGALYRFPPIGVQAMVFPAVALAVARCAIDAVIALAQGKTPVISTSVLRERTSAQVQVARAEALWRAGRVLLYDTLRAAWDMSRAGEMLTLHQKADLLLAMTQAVSGAATAVEWIWGVAGTSGIFRASPLERYFRDMQVLKQHAYYSEQRYETVGRVYLGLSPQFPLLDPQEGAQRG